MAKTILRTQADFTTRPWRVLDSRVVIDNRWLHIRQDTCQVSDERVIDDYYVLEENDVACIFALTDDHQVLLVEQYKHGIGKVCVELPAGIFDAPDANPLEEAQRELLEETGYTTAKMECVGVLPISPSRATFSMHLFVATGCYKVAEQSLDPNEAIVVHTVPFDQVMTLIHTGLIDAVPTIGGVYLAVDFLRRQGINL